VQAASASPAVKKLCTVTLSQPAPIQKSECWVQHRTIVHMTSIVNVRSVRFVLPYSALKLIRACESRDQTAGNYCTHKLWTGRPMDFILEALVDVKDANCVGT
jgi:hypothetical protein